MGLLILALLMFCQRFPQWWNYPVEVTEENREHIFEIASKNDFCDQAVIHWSMSLCRDQRESGNGTYVAGVDTDRRDFCNIAPGNPGGYIRLVRKLAWTRGINREVIVFAAMQQSGR